MGGFNFDKSGTFGSEKVANDYAKRNDLSVHDYQIRPEAEGVKLEIRRSAVEGEKLHDTGEGRKEGFFQATHNVRHICVWSKPPYLQKSLPTVA